MSRQRSRAATSEEEILERYLTPDEELPEARQRRLQSRRSALRRFRIREGPLALRVMNEFIEPECHSVGDMSVMCNNCEAIKWSDETPKCCCLDGAVFLPPLADPPVSIQTLYENTDFRKKIRAYNMLFSFTSLGASIGENVNVDEELANERNGVYTYRIHGSICHRIGSLLPTDDQATFAQMYVYDPSFDDRVASRSSIMADTSQEVIALLERVIADINPYAHIFVNAGERLRNEPSIELQVRLLEVPATDLRRYNCPTRDEVAAIIVGDDFNVRGRDIVLRRRFGGFMRIFESHSAYDALQYPLIFLRGEIGWHINLSYATGEIRNRNGNVSCREFAAFRLYIKSSNREYSLLHRAGRLFQQWCVDQAAKIIGLRLLYFRENQASMRGSIYNGLEDMAGNDHSLAQFGTHFILPPSFTGGERYMRRLYYDAMAIVRAFGKPDLFITITCNPEWPEIKTNLLPQQTASDRPDIVARVFKLKLKSIVADLWKKQIFGPPVAYIYVIEFQKRGLPHAHLLMILEQGSKPITAEDYDKFVCAELPDRRVHPSLYATVSTCMIHGPCGSINRNSQCMKDGKCSKRFPKQFKPFTSADGDGYPMYRRRDDGRYVMRGTFAADNRWVVPYNPYLSAKYNCHINVEICSTISSVKYLYKYVYKGQDRSSAIIGRNGVDEIQQYLDARYLSASESCWRIFQFDLQHKSHSICTLPVHRDGEQFVIFQSTETADAVMDRSHSTKLTAFFDLCRRLPDARNLLYHEVPQHYIWKDKQWLPRQRRGNLTIGRMVSCSPSDIERYYLRLLLCYKRGPTSFDDIKTVNGIRHNTYKDAALASGLLQGDDEIHQCLGEASTFQMPYQLRRLFATILAFCEPANVRQLWDDYIVHMSEDFVYSLQEPEVTPRVIYHVLKDMQKALLSMSLSLQRFPELPQLEDYQVHADQNERFDNSLITSETSYPVDLLESLLETVSQLNPDQVNAYNSVLDAVENNYEGKKLFFLDGPGGTGKSFLLERILAKVRSGGRIALAVASSGIAAQLLTGGRTAHSRFKIKLDLDKESTCNIPGESTLASLIRCTSLIIWDEAPMMHRYGIEAVDRTLRDLMGIDESFGGIVVLFAGDFRQLLPVIKHGTTAQTIGASLKKSYLWEDVQTLRLTINMRLQNSESANIRDFANFLLAIGDGRHSTHPSLESDMALIPEEIVIRTNIHTQFDGAMNLNARRIVGSLYADIEQMHADPDFFADRAVLTPLNRDVEIINKLVLTKLPGEFHIYTSIDEVDCEDEYQREIYPVEFLNSIALSGIPPHCLKLKIGTPVLLMRNIDPEMGLCNGTRLRISRLRPHCIETEILHGAFKGSVVFIPRITLTSNEVDMPFQLRRKQFPLQVAFGMTINKAQGQSINKLAVYLPQQVFSHGQLYVALSRATSKDDVKVLIGDICLPDGEDSDVFARNIVYPEVL